MTTVSAWMLYGLLVSGLLTGAAVLAERSARAAGRSTRWPWAVALLGSLLVPLIAWMWPVGTTPVATDPGLVLRLPAITVSATDGGASLDRVLLAGWVASSLVMLALIAVSWARLQRARRTWREGLVEGEPVLLSDDVGPAVVGVVRGRIVMPRWVAGLERDLQRLLVLHEREHLRAGDPALLLAALFAVACAPWSPFLWVQLLRLRLAIEVDCDARVLRASGDVRGYGALLLEVGRHRGTSGALAVAFGEPLRFLEERIRMIPRALGRRRLARAGALGAAAIGVLLLAVCARDPMSSVNPMDRARTADTDAQEVAPDARTAVVSDSMIGEPRFTPFTERPDLLNREAVAQALESHYPPLLRDAGIGGETLVWFYIDETGRVAKAMINRSSDYDALDQAALQVARTMQFVPARNDGQPVPVWVAIPIVFRAPGDGTARAETRMRRPAPDSASVPAAPPGPLRDKVPAPPRRQAPTPPPAR